MAIKLHRCSLMWFKSQLHPCWRVQSALDEKGITYDVVKGPMARGKRTEVQRLSGQSMYPVIEFEDGSVYREQSKGMRATILAGQLDSKRSDEAAAPPAPEPGGEPPASGPAG